jgi:hypothetical protein
MVFVRRADALAVSGKLSVRYCLGSRIASARVSAICFDPEVAVGIGVVWSGTWISPPQETPVRASKTDDRHKNAKLAHSAA